MAAAAVLFAAVFLLCLRKRTEGEWLAREDTTALRGFFAVFILFVHLPDAFSYLHAAYGSTFEPYIFQGHLAVGAFFALSGYGLARSAERGLGGFFKKRFLQVFFPYLICNLIFFIAGRAMRKPLRLSDMFRSWFTGDPLVTYSWYVVTQLIFYVFFYAAFRFFKSRKMKIAVLFACVLIYMLAVPRLGWQLVTARGCLAFVFGAACGAYKKELDMILSRGKAGKLALAAGALFLVAHILYFAVPFFKEHPVFDFSSVLFAVFIFLMSRVFVLKPPVFHFLGSFSLEIYLYQGLAFTAVRMLLFAFGVRSPFIYACLSIVFAVIGAYIVHAVYECVRAVVVKFSIFKDKSA